MVDYPWYGVVDGSDALQQGDFLDGCPIVVPTSAVEPGNVSAEAIEYDIVVMSQSCDLAHGKTDVVLVCPVWPFEELAAQAEHLRSRKGKDALRQGNLPGYHLLNRCDLDGFECGPRVVDFRNVYGVEFGALKRLFAAHETRLRLLPPYREHLSQAFARFFMRVGLPVDMEPLP